MVIVGILEGRQRDGKSGKGANHSRPPGTLRVSLTPYVGPHGHPRSDVWPAALLQPSSNHPKMWMRVVHRLVIRRV